MVGRTREINRLSARKVQVLDAPGRHADGGGLYLVVTAGGSKNWAFLYRLAGKRREMGLGSVLAVSLARARELADAYRRAVAEGIDPLEARRSGEDRRPAPTFGTVADAYMALHETGWRNAVHRRQWRQTLEVQAAAIWAKPVDAVTTEDVLAVLQPMWSEKRETARRLRGRLERVLDAAKVAGHRQGENPARWRGHLDLVLPKGKPMARGHHAALDYKDAPGFVAALRLRAAVAAQALEFTILTAARSGEVRKMRAGEVDLDAALWTVPAERMKGGRAHSVPLAPRALALLRARGVARLAPDALVFPALKSRKPMSDMAYAALLRRMGRSDVTTHGFRSTFRDWAGDMTDHPREVAESALAHLVGDETERAYRRGDALAKRRHLLEDWDAFLAGRPASTGGKTGRRSAKGAASRKATRST